MPKPPPPTRQLEDLTRLEGLLAEVAAHPSDFPDAPAMAAAGVLDLPHLEALCLAHAHVHPRTFLQRAQVHAACCSLQAGAGSGTPHPAFADLTGLEPAAYGRMLAGDAFLLPTPPGLRVADVLRFHGRDVESVSERVEGQVLRKAFRCGGRPAVLSLRLQEGTVAVGLEGASGPAAMAQAHRATLRLLGWQEEPATFEAAHPDLVEGRKGLRVLLTLDPFEALVWAILGQQVNLGFAYALRRDLIRRAGTPAPRGLIAHPDAAQVAALTVEDLQALRLSRRKAEYLLHAASEVAAGRLVLEGRWTATGLARDLLALRGCGPWTAQYVLMRGLGFGDCVPVGDAGLTLALQRWFRLDARPDPAETVRLMAAFAPQRSLATFHLWAGLKGTPA